MLYRDDVVWLIRESTVLNVALRSPFVAELGTAVRSRAFLTWFRKYLIRDEDGPADDLSRVPVGMPMDPGRMDCPDVQESDIGRECAVTAIRHAPRRVFAGVPYQLSCELANSGLQVPARHGA